MKGICLQTNSIYHYSISVACSSSLSSLTLIYYHALSLYIYRSLYIYMSLRQPAIVLSQHNFCLALSQIQDSL